MRKVRAKKEKSSGKRRHPVPAPLNRPSGASLSLTAEKVALHRALTREDQKLARMYLGAVRVLDDGTNPDGTAQAAHSFRELMEKFARKKGVPLRVPGENLTSKVRALEGVYTRMKKKCGRGVVDAKGGLITEVRDFIAGADRLFDWVGQSMPTRHNSAVKLLRELEPSYRQLPNQLQELNARYWAEIFDFFELTCHHQLEPTAEEMQRWVEALERFLLDRLVPRTTQDFVRIDEILIKAKVR